MRYASIDKIECRNGLGWGVTLYIQGCHFHCKNCFNPETWDFNSGEECTRETTKTILKLIKPDCVKRFSCLGGEPLEQCNLPELADLFAEIRLKKPNIKIWLYTGFKYEDLLAEYNTTSSSVYYNALQIILNNIDVLVDGQFQEDKKDLTYPFAGSTNQRVINMRATREQNKIVLLDI